jgi:hypothetical protein
VWNRVGAIRPGPRQRRALPGVEPATRKGRRRPHRRVVAELGRGPNCNDLVDQRAIEPLAGMAWLNGFPVTVEKISAVGRAANA